jgi:hypothetical protein
MANILPCNLVALCLLRCQLQEVRKLALALALAVLQLVV